MTLPVVTSAAWLLLEALGSTAMPTAAQTGTLRTLARTTSDHHKNKRHEKTDTVKGRGGQADDQGDGGHKSRSHGHRGDDRGGLRLCLHTTT